MLMWLAELRITALNNILCSISTLSSWNLSLICVLLEHIVSGLPLLIRLLILISPLKLHDKVPNEVRVLSISFSQLPGEGESGPARRRAKSDL